MRTIKLELPDTSADLVNKLSKADKDKLTTFVQFWLNSFAGKEKRSALKIMQNIQQDVASKNLSKEEVQELIRESIT